MNERTASANSLDRPPHTPETAAERSARLFTHPSNPYFLKWLNETHPEETPRMITYKWNLSQETNSLARNYLQDDAALHGSGSDRGKFVELFGEYWQSVQANDKL